MDEPCPAKINIPDDRWGIFTDFCHLPIGHDGDHRSPRTACEPPGWLIWADPLENDGSSEVER